MAKYNVTDFVYGGRFHDFCWDVKYNPNATVENGLANCTTMAVAFSYINKLPYPVSKIVSASGWDKVLINGWHSIPYPSEPKVGDIIQWKEHCHVATVIGFSEGEPVLGCSWYTGEHGKSTYNGSYDPRHFSSLKDLSDFMQNNYPFRMYHECSLYEESQRVGGMPENILISPVYYPDGENKSVSQILVKTDEQYVRDEDLNIIGVARKGYYNTYGYKEDGYTWYRINGGYIALVNNRVEYIPANDIEILKDKLRRIEEIINE